MGATAALVAQVQQVAVVAVPAATAGQVAPGLEVAEGMVNKQPAILSLAVAAAV